MVDLRRRGGLLLCRNVFKLHLNNVPNTGNRFRPGLHDQTSHLSEYSESQPEPEATVKGVFGKLQQISFRCPAVRCPVACAEFARF